MIQVKQRLFSYMFFAIAGVFFAKTVHSQNQPKIGDKVPDFVFKNIIGYSKTTTSMKELSGKLIILDFGGIGCSPCVASLPKLDSMQQKFKDRIQIFWITANSRVDLENFLATNAIGKRVHNIPMVPGVDHDKSLPRSARADPYDPIIYGYFKPNQVPYEVWINNDGIIIAKTQPEYVATSSIEQALSGQKLNWPEERYISYNINADLMVYNLSAYGQVGTPEKQFHSMLTSHIGNDWNPSINTTVDSTKGIITLHMKDRNIFDLYHYTLTASENKLQPLSNYIIKVGDLSRIIYKASVSGYRSDWNVKNTYCYEISYPLNTSLKTRNRKILQDLNFYLNLNGRIIDTAINCWVIRQTQTHLYKRKKIKKYTTLSSVRDGLNYLFIPPLYIDNRIKNVPITLKEYVALTLATTDSYGSYSYFHNNYPLTAPNNAKDKLATILSAMGLRLEVVKKRQRMFVLSDGGTK